MTPPPPYETVNRNSTSACLGSMSWTWVTVEFVSIRVAGAFSPRRENRRPSRLVISTSRTPIAVRSVAVGRLSQPTGGLIGFRPPRPPERIRPVPAAGNDLDDLELLAVDGGPIDRHGIVPAEHDAGIGMDIRGPEHR